MEEGGEEGWKKAERKKGKGKREKKVGNRPAVGVPTWVDIARQAEEATRVAATRFFLNIRMRWRVSFVLSRFSFFSFLLFLLVSAPGGGAARRGLISWPRPGGGKNSVYIP
jgi:hypothetical protein